MFKEIYSDSKTTPSGVKRNFQPQKIFIENLKDSKCIEYLETDLCDYFCQFGNVIDVKVLRNGRITR